MSSPTAVGNPTKATKRAKTGKDTETTTIAPQGLYRWFQIEHMMGVSRETWRLRIKAGRAPKPRLEEENLTAWNGADLIAWLDNPRGYKAAPDDGQGGDDV